MKAVQPNKGLISINNVALLVSKGSDYYVQPQMDCGIRCGGAVRPTTNRLERPISDWKRQLCEAGGKRQYCWHACGRKRHSCRRDAQDRQGLSGLPGLV